LVSSRVLFKPASIVFIAGGVLLLSVAVYAFIGRSADAYGTLSGVLLLLFLFIVGGLEISHFRPTWNIEQGAYKSTVYSLILSILSRLFTIYVMWSIHVHDLGAKLPGTTTPKPEDMILTWLIAASVVMAILEVLVLLLVILKRTQFMPTEEEIKATLTRIGGPRVRSVSECPNCRELVEKDWELCPQCGTRLPRKCANCGALLPKGVGRCPSCGADVVRSEALLKSIATLKQISEEEARPEARSVRYARLAEAFLKAGDADSALEAYRKATHFTEYDRKRTNFMTKMAVILHNAGRNDEAMKMIDGAMQLDPQDFAGASIIRDQMQASGLVAKAREAFDAGNDREAMALLADATKLDKQDVSGAQTLAARITATPFISKAKELQMAGKSEDALKQLDEALKADPADQGKAQVLKQEIDAATSRGKEKS
jgi:tetratricopeptide (TPR) repeat protein